MVKGIKYKRIPSERQMIFYCCNRLGRISIFPPPPITGLRTGDKRGVKPQPEPWFAAFDKTYSAACATCHDSLTKEDSLMRKHQWLNLTAPPDSRALTAHLAKDAGGYGIVGTKKGSDEKYLIPSKDDPTYRALLNALNQGKAALDARPRIDMPGAVPIPQERDFGKTF